MSHPETKRRVMGRIDLAPDVSPAGVQHRVSSPSTTTSSVRKGSQVRAKVDMSAFADVSSASTSPSILSAESYNSNQQQYFGRPPLRSSAAGTGIASSSSATSSPFLSATSSPAPSLSPSLNSRSGVAAVASSSNLTAGPSSSSTTTARVVRSPSPIRQAKRSSVVLLQDGSASYYAPSAVTGLLQNGTAARQPRARLASGGSGHARTSSIQQYASAIPASDSHARISGVGGSSGHARNPSVLAFANGSSHARVATGSTLSSFNSSASLAATRSRSPSPPHLVKASSNAIGSSTNPTTTDRRASQGSATSSTINSNSNTAITRHASVASAAAAAAAAAAASSSTPVARSLRIVSPSVAARPPLLTNTSSHSGVTSDAGSGSLPSPSFASAMSRLPMNYRESSLGGGGGGWEEGDTSSGTVGSPNHSLPLLSPALELTPEAHEAKKNRKILDLEITNRSLLAINSGLEVVKLKHVREIKDLKKRLREGRGLGGKMGLAGGDDEEGDIDAGEGSRQDDDEDEDNEEEEEEGEEAPLDTELESAHNRCKTLIDNMVEEARRAILYQYQAEREGKKGGNRVLHPVEVEMLRGGDAESMPMQRIGSDRGHVVAALLDDMENEDVGDAIETASI